MRILMVNKFAHLTGGADQNCLALIDVLGARGHDIAMLSTASEDNICHSGAFIEPTVAHATRATLGPWRQADVARRALWNPDAARAMENLIRAFKPQVVHTHKLYPQMSVAPVVIAARARLPVVQTLHDYELLSASQLDANGGFVDRDEARMTYRALNTATFPIRRAMYTPRVSAYIACSRFVADRYRTKRGIHATVIPYFVESQGEPQAFESRDGAVFVGRLHEEKGVLDVIRAAELLPNLPVAVVGYGPLEQTVRAAERRLPNLEFLGRMGRESILALLATARVFLMPSRWQEPGGIAALEAMSVGTPVVAYAKGGLAEYVVDAGGGRAIEPTVSGLAREIRVLHSDAEQWRKYSRRGIAGIAGIHSAEAYLSRLEGVYGAVAGSSADLPSPLGSIM